MDTTSKNRKRETGLGICLLLISLLVFPKALLYGGVELTGDMLSAFNKNHDASWAAGLGSVTSMMAMMLYASVLCSLAGGLGLLMGNREAARVALLGQLALLVSSIWFMALGQSFISMLLPIVVSICMIAYLSDIWLRVQPQIRLINQNQKSENLSQFNTSFQTQEKRVA